MNKNFKFDLLINAKAKDVYHAIADKNGPSNWWTVFTKGAEKEGEVFEFSFPQAGFFSAMKVKTLKPNTLVEWDCIEQVHNKDSGWSDLNDWEGTTVRFSIEAKDEQTSMLHFEHIGLSPVLECFETCDSAWRYYLRESLKGYLEMVKVCPLRMILKTTSNGKIRRTKMSLQNKEVIRRLYGEVMGKGNMAVADEIFDPNYVDHMPIMETPDRAGLLKSVEAARKAFPDVKPQIIAEISEGEWVAISVYVDGGTQQAEYMGVPTSGRLATWTETHFWKVVDGKIKEHYGNVSMFEIHKMLGSHKLNDKLA